MTQHPNESCQCEALGNCWHIIAAKMSIGVDDDTDKKIYNLTQLRRNHRKKPNKKAGKKRPRPCVDDDEGPLVNGAPDSVYKTKTKLDESKIFPMSSTPHSALKQPHTQSEPSKRLSKKLRFEQSMNIVNCLITSPRVTVHMTTSTGIFLTY